MESQPAITHGTGYRPTGIPELPKRENGSPAYTRGVSLPSWVQSYGTGQSRGTAGKSHRLPHRRQMLPRRPEVIQIRENAPSFADRKTGTPTSRHAALSATLRVCLPAGTQAYRREYGQAYRGTGNGTHRLTGMETARRAQGPASLPPIGHASADAGTPAGKTN